MEQQEKLTVLLVEPGCYPKAIEIEPGLEALQRAVGGWVETVYPCPVFNFLLQNGHLLLKHHHRSLRSWLSFFISGFCVFSPMRTILSGMGNAIRCPPSRKKVSGR